MSCTPILVKVKTKIKKVKLEIRSWLTISKVNENILLYSQKSSKGQGFWHLGLTMKIRVATWLFECHPLFWFVKTHQKYRNHSCIAWQLHNMTTGYHGEDNNMNCQNNRKAWLMYTLKHTPYSQPIITNTPLVSQFHMVQYAIQDVILIVTVLENTHP